MARVVCLALLLGYVAGAAASFLVLPGAVVEPLYGGLVIGGVVLVTGFAAARHVAPWARRVAAADAAPPPEAASAAGPDGAVAVREAVRDETADRGNGAASDPIDRSLPVEALARLLERRRLDLVLTPVTCLPDAPSEVFQVAPRLSTDDGGHLAPAHYLAVAARSGLIGRIEQIQMARAADLLEIARAEGRDVRLLCPVSATALDEPGFAAALERIVDDHPDVVGRLVLLLDRLRLHRPAGAALARLVERGLSPGLRRLGLDVPDPGELERRGIVAVRLEAPRIALRDGRDRLPPSVVTTQKALEKRGITLVLDRAEGAAGDLPDHPARFAATPDAAGARPGA